MSDREERFRRLFDACYSPLHAYARRRIPAADVDDVVADVLTVAWRRLDDVPDGAAAMPWLYGVAHKTLANHHRSNHRRRRLTDRLASAPVVPFPPPSPTGEPLVAALDRLRPDDREVLRLAAWEQLGPTEIAVVLDCTPNAAALRLSRARARLRAELTRTQPSRTQATPKVTDA